MTRRRSITIVAGVVLLAALAIVTLALTATRGAFWPDALGERACDEEWLLVVAADGNQVAEVERHLAPVSRFTISSLNRPRLTLVDDAIRVRHITTTTAPDHLDRFLAPPSGQQVVLANLARGAYSEHVHQELEEMEPALILLGEPALRLASADQSRRDLKAQLPFTLLVVVLVPWLVLGDWRASVFCVAMAGLTAGITLGAMSAIDGISAMSVAVLSLSAALSTLDALHLYVRRVELSNRVPISEIGLQAAYDVRVPCLLTTLTTAIGLFALGWMSQLPALQTLGRWGLLAALVAFVLTFLSGPALLHILGPPRQLPQWPSRWARQCVRFAQLHRGPTLLMWLLLLSLCLHQGSGLRPSPAYPDVYASDHRASVDLQRLRQELDIDPLPLELVLEARTEQAAMPERLVSASTVLQHHIERHASIRLALGPGLFARDLFAREPRAQEIVTRDQEALLAEQQAFGGADWIGDGTTRAFLLTAPLDADEMSLLLEQLDGLIRDRLSDFQLRFAGPAFHLHRADEHGGSEILLGLSLTLIASVLVLIWISRSLLATAGGLLVNLAPLVVLVGVIRVLDMRWTLGLAGVSIMVVAISVDDTIHFLWPMRHLSASASIACRRAARIAGPAIVGTTAVLAATTATSLASGSLIPHQLGLLLPIGFTVALLADATLLPAIARLKSP